MTTISVTGGTADLIREMTRELKKANELKEVELILEYGEERVDTVRRNIRGW